jgi:hypothetical protein
MPRARKLINDSKQLLMRSRETAQLARRRINSSRDLLSQAEDKVVRTASNVTAARWSSR